MFDLLLNPAIYKKIKVNFETIFMDVLKFIIFRNRSYVHIIFPD